MEFWKTWQDVFVKSCRLQNLASIEIVLKNAPAHLQDASKSEKDKILDVILRKEDNIFSFIKDVIVQQDRKLFKNVLEKSFELVQFIMESKEDFEPHVNQTKDICVKCIEVCFICDVQIAAAVTLRKLIKLFQHNISNLPELFTDCCENDASLIISCAIIRYCPKKVPCTSVVKHIFYNLCCELKNESNLVYWQRNEKNIKIYLKCLTDLMENILLFIEDDKAKSHFQQMYIVLCSFCDFCKLEGITKDVVYILNAYIKFFLPFVIQDYAKWHYFYLTILKNNPTQFCTNTLKIFYDSILIKGQNENIYLYFENYFTNGLTDTSLTEIEAALSVYGLVKLFVSNENEKYSPEDINKINGIIMNKILPYLSNECDVTDDLLSFYLESVARLLNLVPRITYQHLNILMQLSVLIIKNFPLMSGQCRASTVRTIKITINDMKKLEKHYYHQYINLLFHKGILWSCCTTLVTDVKLQQEMQNTSKNPISCKDYIPFWIGLFESDNSQTLKSSELFHEFAMATLRIIDNFNLSLFCKEKNDDDFVTSNITKPENGKHFRYFINLVDLFTEVINQTDIAVIQSSVETLLTHFIKWSYKNPLVSGFYKLICSIFNKLTSFYNYENCGDETLKLISKYLIDVLKLIDDFSNELQVSCINLIFKMPLHFLKELADETVPVFKIAFALGLKDISLACSTLDTLNLWTDYTKSSNLIDFCENILPYLEPYLTKPNSNENGQLVNLQKKILVCYGLSSFSKVKDSIRKSATRIKARWEKKSQFHCKLEFEEGHIDLNLEKLLSRTVELTRAAPSRRLRLTACELLHSLMTLPLGRRTSNRLEDLVYLAVLRLGCDSDWAARRLHRPLGLQLCRYYAEQLQTGRLVNPARAFSDLLFEKATQEQDLRFREFCISCLYEFVDWSANLADAPSPNFTRLVLHLRNTALDPLPERRLAAVVLFNRLSPLLGTNMSVFNVYWLDFLRIFVNSLEYRGQTQYCTALDNVVYVIRLNPNPLNAKCRVRKVSPEFPSETLQGAVLWLFECCGSLNTERRRKCMEIFESLCPLLPGHKSISEFIRARLMQSVNSIPLKDLDDGCKQITIRNASAFLRSLDFYIWILDKAYLSVEEVFSSGIQEEEDKNIFFSFYFDFISTIVGRCFGDILSESTNTVKETDELQDLINQCILKIIQLLLTVIARNNHCLTVDIQHFLPDNLYIMISRFLLYPSKIGITAKTLQYIEIQQLEKWFKTMKNKLPEFYVAKIQESLLTERKTDYENFVDIDNVVNLKKNICDFDHFVRNIKVLQNCHFCDFQIHHVLQLTLDKVKEKILALSKVFDIHCVNGAANQKISIEIKNYSINLMNLLLMDYESELVEFIASFFSPAPNNEILILTYDDDALKIPMLEFLLKNVKKTLNILEKNPKNLFTVTENLLKLCQLKKSVNSAVLANEVIARCDMYRILVGDNEDYYKQFFEINRLAVNLRGGKETTQPNNSQSSGLYNWVLEELTNAASTERKLEILEGFFTYIFDGLLASTQSCRVLQAVVDGIAATGRYFRETSLIPALQAHFVALSRERTASSLSLLFTDFMKLDDHDWEQRLNLLQMVLLPALEVSDGPMMKNFFETHVRQLAEVAAQEIHEIDEAATRKQALVTRIAYYKFVELTISKIQIDDVELCIVHSSNNPFVDVNTVDERELARLQNCAVLNCLIVAVSEQDTAQKFDLDTNDVFRVNLWEWIVDCDRHYDLNVQPQGFRQHRINMLPESEASDVSDDQEDFSLDDYFQAYNPDELPNDPRKQISLENDELNNHECMPLLTSLIIQLADGKIDEEEEPEQISPWLRCFFEALISDKVNVVHFALRLLNNVKNSIESYVNFLLKDLARVVKSCLDKNPINYLIRHALMLMVESELESEEVEMAQDLVETLFDRAFDPNPEVYELNTSVIEQVVGVWAHKLEIFRNLEVAIERDKDKAVWMIHTMFRNNIQNELLIEKESMHMFLRKLMFDWQEPTTPKVYEILGFLLELMEEHRYSFVKDDLVGLLDDMEKSNHLPRIEDRRNFCVQNLYLIFKHCPSIASYIELRRFMNPYDVSDDHRKIECYELLLESLKHTNDRDDILSILNLMSLTDVLRSQDIHYLNVAFKTVDTLINILEADQVLIYLEAVKKYTNANNALFIQRTFVYGIFMKAFVRFGKEDDSRSESENKIVNLCTKILVEGVADPNNEIRRDILSFWNKQTKLPSDIIGRLLYILKMFSLDLHSSYAQFLCFLVLELAAKAPGNQNILFAPLCEQPEYEGMITMRRLESANQDQPPPLFVPSLAVLLDRVATVQERELELNDKAVLDKLIHIASNKPIISNLPENKLWKQVFASSSQHTTDKDKHDTCTFVKDYQESLRKEIYELYDLVKFNRNYRFGVYPDVEIRQMDLIKLLQEVVCRDQRFASELCGLLICAVARCTKNSDTYADLLETLGDTCNRALHSPNDFSDVAIEMLHRVGYRNFDARNLMHVAKSKNLHYSGILLIEKRSIDPTQPIYHVSESRTSRTLQHSKELISIYQSIGESDVVQSILKNWINPLESAIFSQGYLAETKRDWLTARDIYQSVCDTDPFQDCCSEGLLRCLNELSSWEQLNKTVETTICLESYNDIWNHSKKDELLPWLFKGHLQKIMEDLSAGSAPKTRFFDYINRRLPSLVDKEPSLLKNFNEELSVYQLCSQEPSLDMSRWHFNLWLENIREQWLSSNPLVEEPKLRLLAQLGRAGDMDAHLSALGSAEPKEVASMLINYWNGKLPEPEERLSDWCTRLSYRLGIASPLLSNLRVDRPGSMAELDVLKSILHQRIRVSELALQHGNREVVRKHAYIINKMLKKIVVKDYFLEQQCEFSFLAARYKLACAAAEKRFQRKFQYYSEAWQYAIDVATDCDVETSVKLKGMRLHGDIASALRQELLSDFKYAYLVAEDEKITELIGTENPGQVEDELWNYQMKLMKCIGEKSDDKTRGDDWFCFAAFCHEHMYKFVDRSAVLQKEFVAATLTAITYGSVKAARYFLDILQCLTDNDNENNLHIFNNLIKAVPTRMFLTCYDQIITQLITPLAPLVLPIVEKLVEKFPSVIMFKFKEIFTSNPDLQKDSAIINMYKSMFNEKVETFFKAVEYLCQPEQYLIYKLSKLLEMSNNSRFFVKALRSLDNEIFNNCASGEKTLKGPIFQHILNKYHDKLQECSPATDFKTLKANIKNICTSLSKNMTARLKNKSLNSSLLENYSPYLSDFLCEDLEIYVPGQHDLNVSNNPVKIIRVDSFVETITACSLKINVIGTNGKTYQFLVKSGVDERITARMQQLFHKMNETLRSNRNCASRRLLVNTYTVVPLSDSLTFVQWLKDTKSLQEYIEFSPTDKVQKASKDYQSWIDQASTNAQSLPSISQRYKQAVISYSFQEVEEEMNKLTNCVEWDLLRKTFVIITSSINDFFKLRQMFITHYAVMCAVDWIAGIGDRRLTNILMQATTGKCFGINFAMAFGNSAGQPVPELVPFRLTSQILGLIRPFTGDDLFGLTMSHVLAAVRSEQIVILTHINMLLHENLNWNKLVNERWLEENNQHTEVEWLPRNKLNILQKKLKGDKPSNILMDELLLYHSTDDITSRYYVLLKAIVQGNELMHLTSRSLLKDHDLTPEEQVQCLVDQSTDINVLGRMWVEWYPFV